MIHVKNLSKTFKVHKKQAGLKGSVKSLFFREYIEKHALQNINLDIKEGEIIGLIGSNGAGKTTLTKILSGIIHPTSGSVDVMGHNPWHRKNEYRKQMSLIMGQKAQLWWDLPAADGFLLLKEIYQIPDQTFKNAVEYLGDCLMIKDQLNIQVRKLSLGERMKVELMAALLHNPKIVYLDEPTIGLDLTAQKAVRTFIKSYRKEFNPTMILTSHYMDDIEELCPRIVVMREGGIVFDGELKSIHQKYAPNKMIQANLHKEEEVQKLLSSFPNDLGTVTKLANGGIKINSPREKTMKAATYLLNNSDVSDLNINEEDIADIIEHIMQTEAKIS